MEGHQHILRYIRAIAPYMISCPLTLHIPKKWVAIDPVKQYQPGSCGAPQQEDSGICLIHITAAFCNASDVADYGNFQWGSEYLNEYGHSCTVFNALGTISLLILQFGVAFRLLVSRSSYHSRFLASIVKSRPTSSFVEDLV